MTVINDFTHRSFTDMADRAPSTPAKPVTPTVVPIRATGTRAPVFCVHPIDGLASRYSALAARIDEEHPVYGLRTSAGGERAASLTALADHYADEIRAVRSVGAVHLLGVEFGGLLAHAVAVALQRQGATVESLTVVDSNPIRRESHVQHDLLAGMGDDVDRSRAEELLAIATHNEALAERHFPGVYTGRALVVSTEGSDHGSAWHAFVRGTVSKYEVPDATSFGLVGSLVDRFL